MLRSFYQAGDAWEERQREITPSWWPTQTALSTLLESMPALKKVHVAPYKSALLALEKALQTGCRGLQKLVLSPHRYENRMPIADSSKTSWSRGWRGHRWLHRVLEGKLLPSLRALVLSVDEAAVLTAFGQAIGTGACPSLTDVDLVGRLDSTEAMTALGDGLTARGAGCARWRRLRLHSQLRRMGAGVPTILGSPSCSQLEELGLEAIYITAADWAAACRLLGSAAKIKELSLVSWGVRGRALPLDTAHFGAAMAANSSALSRLEGLCLGGCCFQPSEVTALCTAIADKGLWRRLKRLDLRSRTLMRRRDRVRLLSALKHCPALEDVRVSRSFDEVPGVANDEDLDEDEDPGPMQDDGMGQAIQALSDVKAVKILSLSPVRQADMHALLSLLRARAAAGLTTPRLSFGTLRNATLTPLAEALEGPPESLKLSGLTALTFGFTRGDVGLQRVARCLQREGLSSLQSLMLHNCVMSRDTAARFLHSIVTGACPQLTYLGLADIKDPGGPPPDSTKGRRPDAMSRALASLFRGERPPCARTLTDMTLRGLQPRDLAAIGRAFALPSSLRVQSLLLDASEAPWEDPVPNCLGDPEVMALVQGFRCRHGSTALVELDMSFERVTKDGAAALAAAVAEGCLPEIRRVAVGGSDKGWPVLGRALRKHRDMIKGGGGGVAQN